MLTVRGSLLSAEGRARLRAELARAMAEVVDFAREEVRSRTPVRTGRLRASIEGAPVREVAEGLRAELGTPLPYAPFVEQRVGMFGRSVRPIEERAEEVFRGALGRIFAPL